MTTTDVKDEAMRAGRLVLAVGDHDFAQAIRIMHESGSGIVDLTLAVATIAAGFAQEAGGDQWRSILSLGLNTLDLDDLPDPDDN